MDKRIRFYNYHLTGYAADGTPVDKLCETSDEVRAIVKKLKMSIVNCALLRSVLRSDIERALNGVS